MTRQLLAALFVLVPTLGIAQLAAARVDSLKYACLVAAELDGTEVDEPWCQCQNDYYASLLTDEDWQTYTEDYYALLTRKSSQRSTPPNSYARAITLGDGFCQRCKADNYQGCLADDGTTPSTGAFARLQRDLRDGQFDQLENTFLFKNFFVNYVTGYSAYCGDRLTDYVERIVTWTEWQQVDHIWSQVDQQTNITRIERRLAPAYEEYGERASDRMSDDLVQGYLDAARSKQLPTKIFNQTLKRIVEPVVFMRQHLEGRCDSQEVKVTYENLYRFSAGLDPVVSPAYLAERQKAEAYRQQRKAEVTAAVTRSRTKAIAAYAERQAAAANKPPKSFSCPTSYQQGRQASTPIKSFTAPEGANFESLTGSWRGQFNGSPMELAVWAGPGGQTATGFSYFPKFDCLMMASLDGQRADRQRRSQAFLRLRAYSPNYRADNCAAMVLDDREGEIHFFGANGFLALDSDQQGFVWYVAGGKLSQHSPLQCDNLTVQFSPQGVSDRFRELLQQYKNPDRRSVPMPPGFLEANK